MRILPLARRILSREERKLVHPVLSRRMLACALLPMVALAACSRPAPPAPAPGARAPGVEAPPPGGPATGAPAQEAPAPAEPAPGGPTADMHSFPKTPIQKGTSLESPAQGAPPPAAQHKPAAAKYRVGIWLESRWVDPETSDAAVSQLVGDLAARGVTDLYIRTGSFRADGSLSLPPAARVGALHRETARRGLRLWAWVPGLRRRIDLSNDATLHSAASAAARLAERGFDGVQIDLEPTPDDDDGYLLLLDAMREALPPGRLLGAATHLLRPRPAQAEWTPEYFAAVARRLDQVAVMAYDTYAKTPEEFRGYVAYQTEAALARSPRTTEVLIGVPTYEDRTERHTPETEPTWAGLAGVADGLRRADLGGRTTGWALYAHFTTSEAEWRLFQERPRPR